jgi:hypothetical protein
VDRWWVWVWDENPWAPSWARGSWAQFQMEIFNNPRQARGKQEARASRARKPPNGTNLRLVLSIAFYAVFSRRIFLSDVIHVTKKYGVKIWRETSEISTQFGGGFTPYFDAVF